jgi:rare lipoprotein A (peptidoglycan hydrolase)
MASRSAGWLGPGSTFLEPGSRKVPTARIVIDQPDTRAGVFNKNYWRFDSNISWYGPGFYGKRTACGYALTQSIVGVAHKTLPCGTKVTFKNPANGRVVTARVVDRGPYVSGRQWDLTGGLCQALGHCYTGSLYWKLG